METVRRIRNAGLKAITESTHWQIRGQVNEETKNIVDQKAFGLEQTVYWELRSQLENLDR